MGKSSKKNNEMSALKLLEDIISSLGGSPREGQILMTEESEKALSNNEHILVSAGTGVGKSFGYLSAGLAVADANPEQEPIVIVTATKALQEQLVLKDLPVISELWEEQEGTPLNFMKALGVNNFLCNLQMKETLEKVTEHKYDLDEYDEQIIAWSKTTESGDKAELSFEPISKTWSNFAVSSGECVGRKKCPEANGCYALAARDKYADADVVVANTALYSIYLQTDMADSILPDHHVVVFDECHKLADSVRNAMSRKITKFSVLGMAQVDSSFFEGSNTSKDLKTLGERLDLQLEQIHSAAGEPLVSLANMANSNPEIGKTLEKIADLIDNSANSIRRELRANASLTKLQVRGERALKTLTNFIETISDVTYAANGDLNKVVWISEENKCFSLNVSDIDVSEFLRESLWDSHISAILCSATVPASLEKDIGLEGVKRIDAPSPFNYRKAAYLYIPQDMPEGNKPEFLDATIPEYTRLIKAAKGRSLLLFTSWKALRATYEKLETELPGYDLMMQDDMPKGLLVEQFMEADKGVLFGTQSFWEGISINGDACVLVVIDKIPFSSPMDPIHKAIRQRVLDKAEKEAAASKTELDFMKKPGMRAFMEVDVPHASVVLAQGVGRLIRTVDDKGVVVVMDSRLATKKSYKKKILNALPPLRRSRTFSEIEEFLKEL